jgi:uncharacterized protein
MRSESGAAREQARERGPAPSKGQPPRGPMSSAPKSGGGGNAFADALKGKFSR